METVATPDIIYHLALPSELHGLIHGSDYRCASLKKEGFIHCCTESQVSGVVERYFDSVTHLFLLTINSKLLITSPVYENTVGGTELFPHIYSPINNKAVVQLTPFGIDSQARTQWIQSV